MMDLSEKQWVSHAVFHPFEGFEDMRWKKSGSLKYAFIIVFLFFAGTVIHDRLYGFQFHDSYDRIFNIIPYIVKSIVLFAAWVVGNWSVCTLLDGEGTLRRICIFSAYALIPYVASLFITTLMSNVLIADEGVFISCVYGTAVLWSGVLLFNAVKTVHQYTAAKTVSAVFLTIVSMFIMMFLLVLVLSLFQKAGLFIYSIYTEIQYRIKV
ncbi:Yip1 family protein [Ruminococcus sp. HUN007]|uniref:Yip1 family protein n=1 Tax=Ruminococcus sp. HUN007 TaxID=1514668 RepID=UPI0005D2C9E3|nr:Yip1 family protein [Ruminococcus sp. HUN007]